MRIVRNLALAGLVVALVAAAGFGAAERQERRRLDTFLAEALAGVDRGDTTAVVLALAHAIRARTNRGVEARELPLYERLESLSLFHMTTAVCLRHGAFGVVGQQPYGPCGPMTRVFLNACWRLGIPARKLQLLPVGPGGPEIHTLAEWRSGERWQVISPSDDFAWRRPDGRIATVEEIRADPTVLAQVHEVVPHFPYRFDSVRYVRWEKLPVPARGLVRAALGERRWASLQTPPLFDQPRTLLFRASLLAALACGAVLVVARRRPEHGRGAGAPRLTRPASTTRGR